MAGEGDSKGITFIAVVITSLLLSSLPTVSATDEGVTIDLDSVNLVDFFATNESYFELEFNLSASSTPSPTTFYVQIHVNTSTIDGNLITSNSIPYQLNDAEEDQVSVNLTQINYGYSVVTVTLSGDLGLVSGNNSTHFQRTIQRLSPLNVSIASVTSIIFESVDSFGDITGNNTISDGDYVQLQVPVINNGDYFWSGSLNMTLFNGLSSETQSSEIFSLSPMTTEIVYFNSTIQVFEGEFMSYLELNGTIDGYAADNYQNFTTVVGPPPLAIIELLLDYNEEDIVSGSNVDVTITAYNNGSVDFSGNLSCYFNQQLIYETNLVLSELGQDEIEFSMTVRPGELHCSASGQRIDELSNHEVSVIFDVESAVFEYAGSFTPSTTDGPWHVGDDSTFSLLVRNSGTITGNVTLAMSSSSGSYLGQMVSLSPDEAGEVTITIPLLIDGTQTLNWSLYTNDSQIDGDISGQLSIPVYPRQGYDLSVYDVMWSIDEGVSATWAINLSSGIDREFNIELGFGSNSQDNIVYDLDMIVKEGSTTGDINFGNIDAQYVIIRVEEINWTAASSFSSYTKSIPQERPVYSIQFNPQSTPNRPTSGEPAQVSVILANSGAVAGPNGVVILYDMFGFKLAESTTSSLTPGMNQRVDFNFVWPEGEEITLNCKWDYGDQTQKVDDVFLSAVTNPESSDEYSIPWTGILGGFAVSSLILLVVRIRRNTSPKQTKKVVDKKSENAQIKLSEVKIEIGCPVCSRQLRIPENYQGSVRCPDCSNSFEFGLEDDDVTEEEHEEVEEQVSDGKIEILCPECSQSLRIPGSYKGSVRCPACKNVFSST